MEELSLEEIVEILDKYKITYKSLLVKGDVDFGLEEIRINPVYNQDVQTLMHEFAHIYYEGILGLELSEDTIEYESQQYLINHPCSISFFENYLELRTPRLYY